MARITQLPRPPCPWPALPGVFCLACLILSLHAHAQQPAGPLIGLPVQQVLEQQRESGFPIVYSTALVTPDLRVVNEPSFRDRRLLIQEILEPHGLTLQELDGHYLVVAQEEPPPATADVIESPSETRAELDEPPKVLETINVTASRYVLWSNSNFYIDQRAIQALPDLGEDPARSAQRLPGSAAGGLSARSHFRGGEHNETAIYLNGLKLVDPFHIRDYHSIFTTIDARALSGVEAFTGGFPASYGDQMSGMLLMETRQPEEPLTTELGLSVYNTSVLSTGHTSGETMDWLFSARRSNLDAVLSNDLGKPDYFDVFAALGLQLNQQHRLSINALFADDDVLVVTESDPEELEQSLSNTRNETLWLSLENEWSPDLSTRTTLSWSSLSNSRVAEVNDPDRMLAAVRDLRDAEIFGLSQDWQYAGWDDHLLSWGLEYRHERASYNYRSRAAYSGFYEFYPGIENPEQSAIQAAPSGNGYSLYLSDRWQLAPATGLQVGLRWDKQDWTVPEFGPQLSPRINVLQRVGENTELRLTWGRYYQSQGVLELQVEDGQDRFFAPQRADHWIAGIQHRFSNGYRLRAEAYFKQYDRLRPRFENQFDPLALIPELAPDRIRLDPSSATARGVELTLDYRGEQDLEWWAVYSWSRAVDKINGQNQLRSWDQRHAVQAGLAWRPGAWEIGLALSVHTGWPTSSMSFTVMEEDDEEIYIPEPGPRNAERFDTFAQIDFRVSRKFAVRRGELSVFFEVTNATNRKNQCCADYDIEEDDQDNVFLDRAIEDWLPLLPAVGVHWTF